MRGLRTSNYCTMVLSMLWIFSACSKKATTSSSSAAGSSSSETGHVPSSTGTSGGGTTGGGVVVTRECDLVANVNEATLAKFFGFTEGTAGVVPESDFDTMTSEQLAAKYITTDADGNKYPKALGHIEGDVTYCLDINSSTQKASLRIEYEDHFGFTWLTIYESGTYYYSNLSATDQNFIFRRSSGFVEVRIHSSGNYLRFARMPSIALLDSRTTSNKDLVPRARYWNEQATLTGMRNKCRVGDSYWTVERCVTDRVFSAEMFTEGTDATHATDEGPFTAAMRTRLVEMIKRIVTFEQNAGYDYEKYKILTGEMLLETE